MTILLSDVFPLLNADSSVKALLGTAPLRVYPFGEAPQDVIKPYAVYTVFNGQPENFLGEAPDIDNHSLQIDVYAETSQNVRDCFEAIRDCLQQHCHMLNFRAPNKDSETNLYQAILEFDLWQSR